MVLLSSFLSLRITDVIDILFVAYLLYQLYMLTKDSVAINIFISIFGIFLFWLLVKALNMELTGAILQQVFSVGAVALVVLFQPEIRRFLTNLGTKYRNRRFRFDKLFASEPIHTDVKIKSIVLACIHMSESKTGALIVITRTTSLKMYEETGDVLDANTSSRLLENIFFKNSPLHDGAVIIVKEKIRAARCILPVSDNRNLPANLGLRHRAALGITENTDALAVIVSEETGNISIANHGIINENVSKNELMQNLERLLTTD
ncbi:MAG: diadenylate cyclase CdaA [Bacteroidales bacterium]|jgi:uncharacterized protein (TIGR00159 family)|nr:diadenylate cyclase CdaA [Bacteroidales bacterium]